MQHYKVCGEQVQKGLKTLSSNLTSKPHQCCHAAMLTLSALPSGLSLFCCFSLILPLLSFISEMSSFEPTVGVSPLSEVRKLARNTDIWSFFIFVFTLALMPGMQILLPSSISLMLLSYYILFFFVSF